MVLLDTDHVSVLRFEQSPRADALRERLQAAAEPLATTVVTVEEQMRGWLAEIGRCRRVSDQVTVYGRLLEFVRFISKWEMLPFDARAANEFERLRKQRIRIGSPDLKIAAIALVNNALLLSANLRDFKKVPGLRVENWLE
ncbi:MAG TPA: type II toxin-antitoxin system VapC family toxin [Gemmataceae bacterium]|nr:type II toxin-antitoxin system VapC family toxin [Gemmataceae bacterium]